MYWYFYLIKCIFFKYLNKSNNTCSSAFNPYNLHESHKLKRCLFPDYPFTCFIHRLTNSYDIIKMLTPPKSYCMYTELTFQSTLWVTGLFSSFAIILLDACFCLCPLVSAGCFTVFLSVLLSFLCPSTFLPYKAGIVNSMLKYCFHKTLKTVTYSHPKKAENTCI